MDRGADDFIPSSPSNSSLSSSDLDTESTGSFFPDRSTTLGTLMGVTFPEAAGLPCPRPPARIPSSRRERGGDAANARTAAEQQRRRRRHRRGRSGWWRLCRDDMVGPKSLGDFLQVERRMGDAVEVADGHFVCGGVGGAAAEHEAVGGGPLFADGRVLPPAPPVPDGRRQRRRRGESGGRLSTLLITGICSGAEG